MTQRYFVDPAGNLIGSFDGVEDATLAAILPRDAVEVSGPPPVSGRQRWDGVGWAAPASTVEDDRIDAFAASPEGSAIIRTLAEIKGLDAEALLAEMRQKSKL
jgi:hypothetical protein